MSTSSLCWAGQMVAVESQAHDGEARLVVQGLRKVRLGWKPEGFWAEPMKLELAGKAVARLSQVTGRGA